MKVTPESTKEKAYIVTGPTSGIGRATALELAEYGKIVLVGRDPKKLRDMQSLIEERGGHAVPIVCDLSDISSVRHAAAEIIALNLPIVGLLNNVGIMQTKKATKNAMGWDMTFATNHLGPFALTGALMPNLLDGANVLFVVSAVEDPERRIARIAGMRGGRFISVEASARGEWMPGGSTRTGMDAYATSKQCSLATAIEFARENPRLYINAIEPGLNPGSGLGRDTNALLRSLFSMITFLPPFGKYRSTPKRSARVITKILTDASPKSGVYYDEKGRPMQGSELVRDPKFQERVVTETRAFLGPPMASRQSALATKKE